MLGTIWMHIKRRTLYSVVGLADLQTSEPIGDMTRLVIYRATDGTLWARPQSEFADGRFVELGQEDKR